MIYLDQAATSWPKPAGVYTAVDYAMRSLCGNPGRSGHSLSLAADRALDDTRQACASLFQIPDSRHLIFTCNATAALNLALKGILQQGDHVITSSMEHNAVSRPLYKLCQEGIEVTEIRESPVSGIDPDDIRKAVGSRTRLVVLNHVSNVTGTVNPVADIGSICREEGILFLLDAAQSAGERPVNVSSMGIDLLAFSGHKGLLGPQGTGGLYIREGLKLRTMVEGGTGIYSQDKVQPEEAPYRYESGTPNVPGLHGLKAGIDYLTEFGLEQVQQKIAALVSRLLAGLQEMSCITVFGPRSGERGSAVSIQIKGLASQEAALILDSGFGIAVRGGLHCAPDAHHTLGTFHSGGTLRISPGFLNTPDDIDCCLRALSQIVYDLH